MNIENAHQLIGEEVIYQGHIREITGVHLYINNKGVNSCRLHLKGVYGYIRIEEAQFFEIIKVDKKLKGEI